MTTRLCSLGLGTNKALTEEERRFVIMDHPYIGDPLCIGGWEIEVCKGLKNSSKINRSTLEDALAIIHRRNPLHLIVDRLQITVNLKRQLGELRCIPTCRLDLNDIFFAPFKDSDGHLVHNYRGEQMYRRYIRNRKPEPTSLLTVVLEPGPTKIITAYIGPQSRPMPGMGANLIDCQWWYDRVYKTGHAFIATENERICEKIIWKPKFLEEIPWTYPEN